MKREYFINKLKRIFSPFVCFIFIFIFLFFSFITLNPPKYIWTTVLVAIKRLTEALKIKILIMSTIDREGEGW